MSKNSNIYDYALTFLIGDTEWFDVSHKYMREEELKEQFDNQIIEKLSDLNSGNIINPLVVSENLFEIMLNASLFSVIGDEMAGDYVVFNFDKYPEFRHNFLSTNEIHSVAKLVGDRFYTDVFNRFSKNEIQSGDSNLIINQPTVAPASNRIVTFTDNQISEIDAQTSLVIEAVEAQNQIGDEPGLREIFLGQLKAGRELIRAGSFRLYLLELTLIETLRFLAKRYEREVIGGLAAALITALSKNIGIDV